MAITIDEMATFCKKKGFVFQNSEIYGGLSGFFDYGPLGSEMKKNIKDLWWKYHVQQREDIVGIDGAIITHPKVWLASGHLENFQDLLLECSKCHNKVRADIFIEEKLDIAADGLSAEEINSLIKKHGLKCPKCKSEFKEIEEFNLMFKTTVGPKSDKESTAYLRPETAQVIFADFKAVVETARLKLPFGIAQMGRSFRNEISPRNFLFRCREFEQMEIEYFIHPDDSKCPFLSEVLDHEMLVYSAEMQNSSKNAELMSMKHALEKNIIKTEWHAYWLATEHKWFISIGAKPENFRIRQHLGTEKSHYALDTWDLEYKFPFGWKELQGIANRTDFDLKQHMKYSKKDLSLYDEKTGKKIVPHVVAEPSLGVDRAFLVFMFDAYDNDAKRGNIVLKLSPKIAPVKIAVFPLVNKLKEKAHSLFLDMKNDFAAIFDSSGSIGRRYARADEIGIPFCITVDFQTLDDNTVTIRLRDTTEQKRVKIENLKNILFDLLNRNKQDFAGF